MEIRKLKIFEENFIPDPDCNSYETEKFSWFQPSKPEILLNLP